jgi:hypothetical protein
VRVSETLLLPICRQKTSLRLWLPKCRAFGIMHYVRCLGIVMCQWRMFFHGRSKYLWLSHVSPGSGTLRLVVAESFNAALGIGMNGCVVHTLCCLDHLWREISAELHQRRSFCLLAVYTLVSSDTQFTKPSPRRTCEPVSIVGLGSRVSDLVKSQNTTEQP